MNAHGDERFHAALASPTRRAVLAVVAAAEAGDPVDARTIADRLELHVTTVRFHLDQLEAVQLVTRVPSTVHGRGRPRVRYVASRTRSAIGDDSRRRADAAAHRDRDHNQGPCPEHNQGPSPERGGHPGWDGGPAHPRRPAQDRDLADDRHPEHSDPGAERAQTQLVNVLAAALAELAERDGNDGSAAALEAGRAWGRSVGGGTIPEGERPAALVRGLEDLGFAPERRGSNVLLHACPFRGAARQHPQIVCAAHLGMIRELMHDDENAVELLPMVEPELCVVALSARGTMAEVRG